MVMLCFRQEEQKENPQLVHPYSLVNRENSFVQLVQGMSISYNIKQCVFCLKYGKKLLTQMGLK